MTVIYEIHIRYHFSNFSLHITFYGHLLVSSQLTLYLPLAILKENV